MRNNAPPPMPTARNDNGWIGGRLRSMRHVEAVEHQRDHEPDVAAVERDAEAAIARLPWQMMTMTPLSDTQMPPACRSVRRSPNSAKVHSATNSGPIDCSSRPLIAVGVLQAVIGHACCRRRSRSARAASSAPRVLRMTGQSRAQMAGRERQQDQERAGPADERKRHRRHMADDEAARARYCRPRTARSATAADTAGRTTSRRRGRKWMRRARHGGIPLCDLATTAQRSNGGPLCRNFKSAAPAQGRHGCSGRLRLRQSARG